MLTKNFINKFKRVLDVMIDSNINQVTKVLNLIINKVNILINFKK